MKKDTNVLQILNLDTRQFENEKQFGISAVEGNYTKQLQITEHCLIVSGAEN